MTPRCAISASCDAPYRKKRPAQQGAFYVAAKDASPIKATERGDVGFFYAVQVWMGCGGLVRCGVLAGVLVNIPKFLTHCRHSTRFLFSAKRKPVEPERNAEGAVVGIASSGTARSARGSGGSPFYGRSDLYERRKCAAVLRGAGDAAWLVSQGGAWWVRDMGLGKNLSAEESVGRGQVSIGCHYEERSDEIIPR